MKLSLFSVQDHYPDGARTVPQLYKQVIDQAVLAEELGYAAFFSAEHHFHPYGVVPNPTALPCAIAQRTTRIRLGTAIGKVPNSEVALAHSITSSAVENGFTTETPMPFQAERLPSHV